MNNYSYINIVFEVSTYIHNLYQQINKEHLLNDEQILYVPLLNEIVDNIDIKGIKIFLNRYNIKNEYKIEKCSSLKFNQNYSFIKFDLIDNGEFDIIYKKLRKKFCHNPNGVINYKPYLIIGIIKNEWINYYLNLFKNDFSYIKSPKYYIYSENILNIYSPRKFL